MQTAFVPDLDAYFSRIGYRGAREPSLDSLRSIVRAHLESIPFENLDVLMVSGAPQRLDPPISIEPAAIEAKLIQGRRGGYCFEQNTYLLEVLKALGFQVTPLSARVRVQRARDFTPPRTHLFLRVDLDEPYLVDVGVGGMSPTCPLRLHKQEEQATPHEARRLIYEGDWQDFHRRSPTARVLHQACVDGAWEDVCEFTLEPMPMIDREVANWFTSTHPRSHFRDRLMVALATPEGRITLKDRVLTTTERSAPPRQRHSRTLRDEQEVLEVLQTTFGLDVPSGVQLNTAALPGW